MISLPFSSSSALPNISGITSFDRRTNTDVPMAFSRFFLFISSVLFSVADCIVTPPNSNGSNTATGVTFPVRPTSQLTEISSVVASSASNLYANAHLGNFPVYPSISLVCISAILITAPSISTSKLGRCCSKFLRWVNTSSIDENLSICEPTLKRFCFRNSCISP
ncbi:hypothetical protein D3C74_331590 [compost metagenome]